MVRSVAIVAMIEQDANVTHAKCTTLTLTLMNKTVSVHRIHLFRKHAIVHTHAFSILLCAD